MATRQNRTGKATASTLARAGLNTARLEASISDPGGIFDSPAPFPSGLTFQNLGLPQGFQLIPQANPLQQLAFDRAAQFGQQPSDALTMNALTQQLQGNAAFEFDPVLRQQFFRQAIEQPAMERLSGGLAQQAANFLPGGQTGAFQRTTAEALRGASRDIAALQTSLLRDDERAGLQSQEAALGRQFNAIPLSQSLHAQQISVPFQIGAQQRAIDSQLNTGMFGEALLAQPFSDPRLPILGALRGNALTQIGNPGLATLGGALQGLGGAAGLFGSG